MVVTPLSSSSCNTAAEGLYTPNGSLLQTVDRQEKTEANPMTNFGKKQSMWDTVLPGAAIWVPSEDLVLQLRSEGSIHMVGVL